MAERGTRVWRWVGRLWRVLAVRWHRWIERTANLLTLSVLVVLPVVIGGVTLIANREPALPYLLFPPLASGGYTLFADPGDPAREVRRFVGGLTIGAGAGWLALEAATQFWYQVPAGHIHAGAAALGVFATAAITLAVDMRVPAAFSTALLVHVSGPGGVDPIGYVVSVVVGSVLVAGVYVAWHRGIYARRASLLYDSMAGDDQVLVPMYGSTPEATATLGARLAAAHDAGRVVLLGLVDCEASVAHPSVTPSGDDRPADEDPIASVAADLERSADRIADHVDVPIHVAVARGGSAAIERTAHETDSDLVVAPAIHAEDGFATALRRLFDSDIDILIHDSRAGRTEWNRVMVPVRRASDVAHSMIDFAGRLAGGVSVCRCVAEASDRPDAERALERLVSAFDSPIETRVAVAPLDAFLEASASQYDLVIVGASRDRSLPSRILVPPTYHQLSGIETDLAIVDRNYR